MRPKFIKDMEKQFGKNAKEILSLFPGSPDSDASAASELVSTAGQFGASAFFAANKWAYIPAETFFGTTMLLIGIYPAQ